MVYEVTFERSLPIMASKALGFREFGLSKSQSDFGCIESLSKNVLKAHSVKE